MSSSVQLPSPDDDYTAPRESSLTLAFWDAALTSVGRRIRALEAVKANWEELIAIGTGQALEVIAANVEPQLAALTTTINQLKADVALAQDAIASIVTGSVPASAVSETASRIWLTPTLRDLWNSKQAGDPTLAALAALETSADKLIYATGADTFALATITALAREALASGTGAAFRTAIAAAGAEETSSALALKASTALVSTKASKRNRHLNKAFQICQDRAAGATVVVGAGNGYIFDGAAYFIAGAAALTCSQAVKATPGGSPYRLRAAVSTADTAVVATDRVNLFFPIEGVDVADLQFGTPAAKSFTWQGVLNAPAGLWGVSFSNGDGTRSYVVPFTVPPSDAGKDLPISAVVPGDTAGTWIKDASGVGIQARLCLMAGANFRTATPGAWQAGNFLTTSAQTNGVASAANVFEVADIGFYAGTELPDWEMPSYVDDLLKCQRYFTSSYSPGVAPGTTTVYGAVARSPDSGASSYLHFGLVTFPVVMRSVPSIICYNPFDGNTSAPVRDITTAVNRPLAIDNTSLRGFSSFINNSSANQSTVNKFHYVANARL